MEKIVNWFRLEVYTGDNLWFESLTRLGICWAGWGFEGKEAFQAEDVTWMKT